MSFDHVRRGVLDALRTVGRGFLLGIGFCIATGCTYAIVWEVFMSKQMAAMEGVAGVAGASAKDLIISDVEESKHDGVTAILGSVKNTGAMPARGFQIQASLFDHGKFVDQYSTYLSGKLGPGESQYFKISCGCKDTPPAEHDSYKVAVVGGY